MVVRTILRQPEKSAQRGPGGKGRVCYYCGKEGHLKRDCPQTSKLLLGPCPVCKGPHGRRDCPQRHRPQRSDSQDNQDWSCPGVPTQAPILITSEETWVLITAVGQSVDFLSDTGATYSVLTEAPGPLSSWSTTVIWLSGWAKRYYFSCPLSCNWDSVLFFTWVFDHARVSLTPLGEGYTEQGPCLCFHDMETSISLPLIEQNVNPRVWADGKTVGWTQNAIPVVVPLKDLHIFPYQKQYPLKPKVMEGLKPIENLKEWGLLIPCNHSYFGCEKVKR